MNRTSARRVLAPGVAALALGLGLTACGGSDEESPTGDSSASVEVLAGTLNGAGSSAQEVAQAAWQAGFQSANPDVTVNYDPSGSGAGREQFIAGGVSFAGSDAALDEGEGELAAAKKRCDNQDPIEVPNYVSAIAVIYNVDGVENLRLSPEVLGAIFDGTITTWSDPRISADNPGTDLPVDTITPVHRADDSGTTESFTAYLSGAGSAWPHEPDGVWPLESGEAAQGTSGVVAAVENAPGTIGYVDESQAGGLSVAAIKVGEEYVAPSAEAAAEILESSPRVEGRPEVDMAFERDGAIRESGVYPIVLTSYLLACQRYESASEADLVKAYLSYVVGPEGQKASAQTAGSAPLPTSLQDEALGIIEKISPQGGPHRGLHLGSLRVSLHAAA